jgi:hypothetical protein
MEMVRESRKASREWVNHRRDPAAHPEPDRLRWIDYRLLKLGLPRPMTPYLVAVLIRDAADGTCSVQVGSAGPDRWPHDTCPHTGSRGRGPASAERPLLAAFGRFIRRFRGPATRHLPGYAAWFATRVEAGIEPPADLSRSLPREPTRFWTCMAAHGRDRAPPLHSSISSGIDPAGSLLEPCSTGYS